MDGMEIFGLPAHALVVHAAVVLTPLAVLLVTVFAVVPSWRWASRWPALLATLAATVAVVVAKRSGEALYDARRIADQPPSAFTELVATHSSRAGVLLWATLAFAAVVLLGFFLLPAASPVRDGRLGNTGRRERWVALVVPAALVALGGVVLVWVVLTGHAGARAVWG
jgi:hypothetical protein